MWKSTRGNDCPAAGKTQQPASAGRRHTRPHVHGRIAVPSAVERSQVSTLELTGSRMRAPAYLVSCAKECARIKVMSLGAFSCSTAGTLTGESRVVHAGHDTTGRKPRKGHTNNGNYKDEDRACPEHDKNDKERPFLKFGTHGVAKPVPQVLQKKQGQREPLRRRRRRRPG